MNGLDLGPEAASEEQQRPLQVGRQGFDELRLYMTGLVDTYAQQLARACSRRW